MIANEKSELGLWIESRIDEQMLTLLCQGYSETSALARAQRMEDDAN